MVLFETPRLLLRAFAETDLGDLKEIAVSKESSEFACADAPWPVTDEGCREMLAAIAGNDAFVAVESKECGRVICLIALNGFNEDKILDIGHVINHTYCGMGYEAEALGPVFRFAFESLDAAGIESHWALADQAKLDPLRQLGMRITRTFSNARFTRQPGEPPSFEACTLLLTKREWLAREAAHR